MTQLATRLKLHPNTVRFHLDTLTARGLAHRVPSAPNGPGSPAMKVRALAVMDRVILGIYGALGEVLTIALSDAPGGAELERRAGRAWADQILTQQQPSPTATADSVLMEVLDSACFAPERTGDAEIGLHNCPFLELVDSAGLIVCAAHLGLMRRTLAALGSDRDVLRLDPFVRPGLCVAHPTERAAAA